MYMERLLYTQQRLCISVFHVLVSCLMFRIGIRIIKLYLIWNESCKSPYICIDPIYWPKPIGMDLFFLL